MSADSYKYDPAKPYPYDDVNLCPCAECGRVRAGRRTDHDLDRELEPFVPDPADPAVENRDKD